MPDLDLYLLLLRADHVAVGILDLLVDRLGVFVIVDADILTPTRLNFDPTDIAVDAKRHPETRRNEGLIAGGVDLVRRIRFGIDTTCRAVEFGARFVAPVMDFEIVPAPLPFRQRAAPPALRCPPLSSSAGASLPTK